MLGEAVGGLIGGALGTANSLGSSALGWYYSKKAAERNYKYSEKFAKNTPSWNVAGLEKAGLNPMLAAGANATSGAGSVGVGAPSGGNFDVNTALEGAATGASIANTLADKNKKDAEAKAITKQADAAERTSKANEWQIWDNKNMKEGGVKAWVDVGGKLNQVNSIRINKVTGKAFTLDGQPISKMSYTDVPVSAKQASTPIYQMFRVDGSGINSTQNAPVITLPYDGIKFDK